MSNLSEQKLEHLKCMDKNCESELRLHEIQNYLTENQYIQWQYLQDNKRVQEDSSLKHCPTLDCQGILKKLETTETNCEKCKQQYCFDCLHEYHPSFTCTEMEKQLKKKGLLSDSEISFQKFIIEDKTTKKCPKCRVCINNILVYKYL